MPASSRPSPSRRTSPWGSSGIIATRDHLAALLDLPTIQQSERQVGQRVEELIELMNLQSYRDKFVSELSTGVRRIVDLTMVIAHDPTVLLLDEPSSGVAQRETEALGPLLKNIQRATQCSIVIIEHDMPLIRAVSDEIIALDLGRVVTRGAPSAVLSDARVVASYLGGDVGVIQRSGRCRPACRVWAPIRATGRRRLGEEQWTRAFAVTSHWAHR